MKTLKHTIKKQWFDLIKSGVKKEEYKEIKPFWISRLLSFDDEMEFDVLLEMITEMQNPEKNYTCVQDLMVAFGVKFKHFDEDHFFNAAYFSEAKPNFKTGRKGIRIGTGKPEWGAVEGKYYFIIELN